MPRQTPFVHGFHERVWIKLLHVPHPWFHPSPLEHQHCADHGWNTCGVRDALGLNLEITLVMVADVVNKMDFGLAIFDALDLHTNAGLPGVIFRQRFGRGQHGFQEFYRRDLHSAKVDRFNAGHADSLEHR